MEQEVLRSSILEGLKDKFIIPEGCLPDGAFTPPSFSPETREHRRKREKKTLDALAMFTKDFIMLCGDTSNRPFAVLAVNNMNSALLWIQKQYEAELLLEQLKDKEEKDMREKADKEQANVNGGVDG